MLKISWVKLLQKNWLDETKKIIVSILCDNLCYWLYNKNINGRILQIKREVTDAICNNRNFKSV